MSAALGWSYNSLTWVLGTKLNSFGRTVHSLLTAKPSLRLLEKSGFKLGTKMPVPSNNLFA